MPIDPAGTKPGLAAPTAPQPTTVHIKCKRPGCPSIQAIEMTPPNNSQGRHLYRCAQCNTTWGVATGGTFNM